MSPTEPVFPMPYDGWPGPCKKCGDMFKYSERWDSSFCPTCKEWRETACSCGPEDECPFSGRPESPEENTEEKESNE